MPVAASAPVKTDSGYDRSAVRTATLGAEMILGDEKIRPLDKQTTAFRGRLFYSRHHGGYDAQPLPEPYFDVEF
jgi:hypothetical protein